MGFAIRGSRAGISVGQSRAGNSVGQSRAGNSVGQSRAGISVGQSRAGISVGQSRAGISVASPLRDATMAVNQPPELAFSDLPFTKPAIRSWLLKRRNGSPKQQRSDWSRAAAQRVLNGGLLDAVEVLAVYAAFGSEADPFDITLWQRQRGRQVAFPRVNGTELRWHLASPDELHPVPPWSIPEPDAQHPTISISEIDGWIVPGVGFTKSGFRLGYGRGYYDRVLAQARPGVPRVGFGFGLQIVERLPAEPHDLAMQAVATEDELIVRDAR